MYNQKPRTFNNSEAFDQNVKKYKRMKYGLFVHYAWAHDIVLTTYNDGRAPASIDELANMFNAAQLANDVADMGVEYVIFTAWHYAMNLLYPSKRIGKYRDSSQKHYSDRDVIQDLIDALKSKQVPLILYCHPVDGHDFTPKDQELCGWNDSTNHYRRWNDFVNDIYDEFCARHGNAVFGYWFDGGFAKAETHEMIIDKQRLSNTIRSHNPGAVFIKNTGNISNRGDDYFCPIQSWEWYGECKPKGDNSDEWPCSDRQINLIYGKDWLANEQGAARFSARTIKRFTAFQASRSIDGGIAWGAGCFTGSGDIWQANVKENMIEAHKFFIPIRESICNVNPSISYITQEKSKIIDLPLGLSATQSPDGKYTYIHVFAPPSEHILKLPPPQDGMKFTKATLATGEPVVLHQDENSVVLTITGEWDPIVTVIKLKHSTSAR